MAFRFRKSIGIKGFKINLSKSGASLSLGVPGFTHNIGKRGGTTLGIPGTGLSYKIPKAKRAKRAPQLTHAQAKAEWIASLTPEERDAAAERGKDIIVDFVLRAAAAIFLFAAICRFL
jgi:hypothetical protein